MTMRVLLLTQQPPSIASARKLFYQMHGFMRERKVEADLNQPSCEVYDMILVHDMISGRDSSWFEELAARYPSAHLGVWGPSYQSVNRRSVEYVDFFVVPTFLWRELLLPYGRRVYVSGSCDYELVEGKSPKSHTQPSGLTLGYHGNERHYAKEFFPHIARALQLLMKTHKFTLKVVTNHASNQPRIRGIQSVFVEWELATYEREMATFDIGLCPSLSTLADLADPSVFIRGSNRARALLCYGIPSVVSPLPETCQVLMHGETALFAVTMEGWVDALERLITQPELRNRIGQAGARLIREQFSSEAATNSYLRILETELQQPRLATPVRALARTSLFGVRSR